MGIGHSMGQRAEAVWRSWGVQPLTEAAGLALFDDLMSGDSDPIALDIDWRRYLVQMGDPPPWLSAIEESDSKLQTSGESQLPLTPETLRALIQDTVARVLGHAEPTAIESDRPFSEQGLDSLMATELAAKLSTALGIRLPGTLVYNYPTLDALAAYLLTRITPTAPPPEADATINAAHPQAAEELEEGADDLLNQLEDKLASIDRMLGQNR